MNFLNYKNYYLINIYPILLGFIGATIIFREFSAYMLAFLTIITLAFFKKLFFKKKLFIEWVFISLPLLLQILFFWNNESYYEGIKELEKYTAYFVLPLIILFQKNKININTILKWFSFFFTTILFLGVLK